MTSIEKKMFQKLRAKRQRESVTIEDPEMQGIKESVTQKYSDAAHFVYELLQNADDVAATECRFVLESDGLRFSHNGKIGFSVSDVDNIEFDKANQLYGHVNAITAIGSTTKASGGNEIGKFGVGFKAVFQYTNTPHIYDDGFWFRIERFIVPELELNDFPDREPGETLFYFPFDKSGSEITPERSNAEISEKLSSLIRPLLFLKSLNRIDWKTQTKEGLYEVRKTNLGQQSNGTIVERYALRTESEASDQLFRVFRNKPEGERHEVIAAFPLDKDNKLTSTQKFEASCYFTTQKGTQLSFIVQAPFLLTDSREGIREGDSHNQHLVLRLASLVADSIGISKELGLLNIDLLKALPLIESDFVTGSGDTKKEEFFYPIYKAVLEKLKAGGEVIPCQSGSFMKAEEVMVSDSKDLISLLDEGDLSHLFQKRGWLVSEITNSGETASLYSYLTRQVRLQSTGLERFISCVVKDTKFIEPKSDAWMMTFYTILLNLRNDSENFQLVRKAPVIRTQSRKLISAFTKEGYPQAFMPMDDMFDDDNTVSRSILQNESARTFLQDRLKLAQPDQVDRVLATITNRYESASPSKITKTQNKADIELVVKVLESPSISKQKLDTFKTVIQKLKMVLANSAQNEKKLELRQPETVHVPSNDNLAFFAKNPNIWFPASKIALERLERIGCIRDIRIRSNHRQSGPFFYLREYSGDYQRGIDHFTPDATIEGLEFALRNMNKTRSAVLWKTLLKDSNPKKIRGIVQTCPVQTFSYERISSTTKHSKLGKLLTEGAWLYSGRKKAKPNELSLADLDQALYDIQSPTSKNVAQSLGFKTDLHAMAKEQGCVVLKESDYERLCELERLSKTKNEPIKPLNEPVTPYDLTSQETEDEQGTVDRPKIVNTGGGGRGTVTRTTNAPSVYGAAREQRFFDGLKKKYANLGYIEKSAKPRNVIFEKDGEKIEILWCNDDQSNKVGYDFEIKKNGLRERVIELKTSVEAVGGTFEISGAQWDAARDMHQSGTGHQYELVCISVANSEKPIIRTIVDPYGKHKEKRFRLIEVGFIP